MGLGDQFFIAAIPTAHVCFGSKADIKALPPHVRFTPKSGHCRAAL
jgi:hypothetical protein